MRTLIELTKIITVATAIAFAILAAVWYSMYWYIGSTIEASAEHRYKLVRFVTPTDLEVKEPHQEQMLFTHQRELLDE